MLKKACIEARPGQDEPGVYIPLTALAGGARDLKRVYIQFFFILKGLVGINL